MQNSRIFKQKSIITESKIMKRVLLIWPTFLTPISKANNNLESSKEE